MIELPYAYPDYFGNLYHIIGWVNEKLLVKRPDGRVSAVPEERVEGLLKSIGLTKEDVPGRKVKFQWEEVE